MSDAAPDMIDPRDVARAAVSAAVAAGKLGPASHFDAVRFACTADVPVWALRGAWEEALGAMSPPDEPPSDRWDSAPYHDGACPEADPDSLPPDEPSLIRIGVGTGEILRMVRECVRALGDHDHNLFQRSMELVRIVREPERREPYEDSDLQWDVASGQWVKREGGARDVRRGADIITRPGTPRLCPAEPVILERIDAVTSWEKFDRRHKGGGQWVPANPDPVVVSQVAKRKTWPGIRPIKGILENACLGPGGRVIQTPGYDEETGFFLLPSCDVGPVILSPTREQAQAALRYLWIETACDFPFRGMAEPGEGEDMKARFLRAVECPDAFVGITMALTILARPAIDGACPAGLFEAASQGSGKSKQINVASVITTGRPAPLATFPMREGRPNEEELEKVIMGYAQSGARLIAFDNIRGLLGGASLERALTSEKEIEGRILGRSGQHAYPWHAILMFSGNNMAMNDDVAQRMLVSRIESSREDPRKRPPSTFRHANLLGYVRNNRAKMVRASLVILRGYRAALERGEDVPRLSRGNFEEWAGIVASALRWAGGPDILRAFPESGRGGDDEGDAHETLIRNWRAEWNGLKAASIIDAVFRGEHDKDTPPDPQLDDVRSAIRALCRCRDRDTPSSHAFGIKLRGFRGKPRGGYKIENEASSGNTGARWCVVPVGESAPVAYGPAPDDIEREAIHGG